VPARLLVAEAVRPALSPRGRKPGAHEGGPVLRAHQDEQKIEHQTGQMRRAHDPYETENAEEERRRDEYRHLGRAAGRQLYCLLELIKSACCSAPPPYLSTRPSLYSSCCRNLLLKPSPTPSPCLTHRTFRRCTPHAPTNLKIMPRESERMGSSTGWDDICEMLALGGISLTASARIMMHTTAQPQNMSDRDAQPALQSFSS